MSAEKKVIRVRLSTVAILAVAKGIRNSSIILLLNFLLFLTSSHLGSASPLPKPGVCGPAKCHAELEGVLESETKLHYKEGSVYTYLYVVNGTTSVLGGPSAKSGLHLSANVSLRFISACDSILFMKDVSIVQSHLTEKKAGDGEDSTFTRPKTQLTFAKALEQYSLRFSYADGMIEEICPHSEESSWALNIKRGFLSAFQNTMRRLDLEHKGEEDDVHGHCKVEYRLGTATSSTLTIEKIKDISSCGDKFGILSSIQGSPYTFGTHHQSMPAMVSTSFCEQVVDRNLVSGVQCSETHHLQPLARGASGAHMNIQQNLNLISVYIPSIVSASNATGVDESDFTSFDDEEDEEEEEDAEKKEGEHIGQEDQLASYPWIIARDPDEYIATLINKIPESISRRESLLFRHEYNLGHMLNDYNTARGVLTNFCTSMKEDVGRRSGELFETLIYVLRGLSQTDMMSLSKDAPQICQGDREPFDDALEAVGTAASLAVMRERILKGDSTPDRIKSWINSLSFIPKPDLALLTEAVSILRARDNYPNILLSFSNLAHSYCKDIGHEICVKHQPISILTKLFEKYFAATACATKKRKELDQMLMYLKGLGNFGLYANGTIQAFTTCMTKNDKPEVRVAAIEALRRMPCKLDLTLPVLKSVFENQLEDAEVRIAAFIGIMRCPTYPTIRWIKRALDEEQVNQVGSFVSTLLTNLQETALPSKGELQALLADEQFSTKFSTDIRKFSRNFELSSFYKDANLGVALDGNLIFSQTSYLPRSTSFNLTVDLFGESINVLEGKMRVENFEHYVESIVRRRASGKSSPFQGAAAGISSGKRREKRGTLSKRKMRTLALEYDAMKRYYSDPIASLSLRTFGNEIYFKRLVGLEEQARMMSDLNPLRAFEWMSNEDTNWQKSRLLLDSSYIIPTGVGFPLNLTAQASTIIRLESQSLIDSSSNFSGFKLKGKFIPSAMLTVSGGMSLSASDIHTGLKVRAHLRSSTAVEGTFNTEGTNLVDVEFGLPKNQLELLEYKSELMFVEGDEFRATGQAELGQNRICTGGAVYTYLGLKLCSSSHFSLRPKGGEEEHETLVPHFPLNGPSYFTLTLDKANPSLLKTRFHYLWNNNQVVPLFKDKSYVDFTTIYQALRLISVMNRFKLLT